MSTLSDLQAMRHALVQAQAAGAAGEVPVGAVVVKNGEIIAAAGNAPIARNDPCAHAEILALRAAAKALGNYRLDGCELFVTLEPCAMCSGAILQARLTRVVFGATEPKTGAAGSVLNLFVLPQLNHHTQVTGGVLAEESVALLAQFFQHKRQHIRLERHKAHPLRDDALRTPEARFAPLPACPWPSNYLNDLPALSGWRLHYLDVSLDVALAIPTAQEVYLCLHGSSTWGCCFHPVVPALLAAGGRVVVPDLIGFGQSDKPKKTSAHSLEWHCQVLLALMQRLDVPPPVLVVQAGQEQLGRAVYQSMPECFQRLWVMPVRLQTPEEQAQDAAAREAPFPDAGHRAAPRAFAALCL